ncbi:MAG: PHP domain-containing protein [Candidatus Zixiibacteriota bacterium]|nr:MAG: PHP domain-containing protein [candidate division Zixibacteria bacterium]
MKKEYIDLHIHTKASDGIFSPAQVVEVVLKLELKAFSITDHDTINGFAEAEKLIRGNNVEIIPGVELSCHYRGSDVHILGYYIDYANPEFEKKIFKFRQERYERGEEMVSRLNELGINLSMETVKDIAGKSAVGRPHVADALLKEEFVQTYDEAFARYIGYHAPAYVPKQTFTPEQGIDLIHLTRGVAVLAHPGTLKHDEFVPDFIAMGLDGIEAYHSQHSRNDVTRYKNMADKFGVIYTGGSDCHGPRKGNVLIGNQRIPYKILENLKKVKESK